MRRKGAASVLAAAVSVAAALMGTPAATAAPPPAFDRVTITADNSAVVGDSVTVTIAATGLVDAYAYEFTVGYDPSTLAFDPASPVYPPGGFGSAAPRAGAVTFTATRLGTSPGLSGDRMLVTFHLSALTPGEASVSLTDGLMVDSALVATTVTPAPGDAAAVVTITASTGGGDLGSSGGVDVAGSTAGGAAAPDSSTGASPLARTGTDMATWVAVGMVAAMVTILGIVLVLRRRGIAQ